jgi:DNA recombination protein RmuC
VNRQLQTASKTIEEAGTRTRVMERKLRSVEQMDPVESAQILSLPASSDCEAEESRDDNIDQLPGAA